jgi:hypothetical protein
MAFTQTAGTMLLKDYPGPRGAPTITYVAVSPQERYADPKARDVLMVDKHTLLVEDRQRVSPRLGRKGHGMVWAAGGEGQVGRTSDV